MQDEYASALQSAKKELGELILQNREIEQRIVRLQQTISALEALQEDRTDEKVSIEVRVGGTSATYNTSLTDAIREIFKQNPDALLTATQVRDLLRDMGVNLNKYSQHMVPIHNTLKRLAAQGELGFIKSGDGKNDGYRWINPFVRALAKVSTPPANSIASGYIRGFGEIASQAAKHKRISREHTHRKEDSSRD